jgi:hypothetical protein
MFGTSALMRMSGLESLLVVSMMMTLRRKRRGKK